MLACLGPIQFLGGLYKVKLHKPRDKLVRLKQNVVNTYNNLQITVNITSKCKISKSYQHVRVKNFNRPQNNSPKSAKKDSNQEWVDMMRHSL